MDPGLTREHSLVLRSENAFTLPTRPFHQHKAGLALYQGMALAAGGDHQGLTGFSHRL